MSPLHCARPSGRSPLSQDQAWPLHGATAQQPHCARRINFWVDRNACPRPPRAGLSGAGFGANLGPPILSMLPCFTRLSMPTVGPLRLTTDGYQRLRACPGGRGCSLGKQALVRSPAPVRAPEPNRARLPGHGVGIHCKTSRGGRRETPAHRGGGWRSGPAALAQGSRERSWDRRCTPPRGIRPLWCTSTRPR
jgi:hypothetical protein